MSATAEHGLVVERDGKFWDYDMGIIEVADCYTDRYQRPLNEAWLRKHGGEHFRPDLLGTVSVSVRQRRNKIYAVMDGQHRIELCTREGHPVIAAVLYSDLTIQDEAALFTDFQRERRTTKPLEQFAADLIAGKPHAQAIDRIVREVGLKFSPSTDAPGQIKCVRLTERIYEEDPARLRTILSLAQRTWRDIPGARSESLLRGLWQFVRDEKDLDEERFVERLSGVTPSYLTSKAHQLRDGKDSGGTLPGFLSEAISNAYRSRKRR